MATLEDSLRKYLKNRQVEDYTTYVSKRMGENARTSYADALQDADRDYARTLAGYGSGGVSLSDAGLGESGYADYLNGVAYATRQKARTDALANYKKAQTEQQGKYADYLQNRITSLQNQKNAVLRDLIDRGVMDSDTAYKYALTMGLSDSDAREVGYNAVNTNQNDTERMYDAIRFCISANFFYKESKLYAERMGFNEESAQKIAETVSKYFNYN